MSFFKKFKDRLTAPHAQVSLQFSRNSFALGENIEGNMTVASSEEFEAKEIRCEFQCVEEAKKTQYVFDSAVNRNVLKEVMNSATLFSAKPAVSGPLHITNGFSQTYPLSINVPIGGRPTFKSIDSKVTWTIKGVIAIEGRPDVTSSTTEIQVSQPSAAPIIREKEIVREVVMIPCKYCGTLMPQTDTTCPNCGAKRTG
jgi:rubrerythrin